MSDTGRGIVPTSEEQVRATRERRVAAVERIRPGITAVPLRMPGGFLPYSLAYLIRDECGDIHVVDPGSDIAENRCRLQDAMTDAGGSLRSIIVTHLHSDHFGLAAWLHHVSGAPVVMHRADVAAVEAEASGVDREAVDASLAAWGVPPTRRDELIRISREEPATTPPSSSYRPLDGLAAVVDVPGVEIEAINTPGHTAGSIVLKLPHAGVLFTGDLVLPHIHSGIGLGGSTGRNPLTDYLTSLDAMPALDGLEVLPGHGYRFVGVARRAEMLRAHHLRRARQVGHVAKARPDASLWEIASYVSWTAGWQNMRDFFLLSALRQTQMYLDFVARGQLPELLAEKEGT